jgi:hypothetical protein
MGRAGDCGHAVGGGGFGHCEGGFDIGGAVVEARQHVAVQIDQSSLIGSVRLKRLQRKAQITHATMIVRRLFGYNMAADGIEAFR